MTPLMLQDELVNELKDLLADYVFKAPTGKRVPINVFPQNIPVNETDEEEDPIPYVIVRLNKGSDDGTRDSNNTVKLVIIIGIWDDGLDAQGHRSVMNIIHKIYARFQTNPNLRNIAVFTGKFDWAIQEDNYYPYCFGACSLDFHIAAIRREDPFV